MPDGQTLNPGSTIVSRKGMRLLSVDMPRIADYEASTRVIITSGSDGRASLPNCAHVSRRCECRGNAGDELGGRREGRTVAAAELQEQHRGEPVAFDGHLHIPAVVRSRLRPSAENPASPLLRQRRRSRGLTVLQIPRQWNHRHCRPGPSRSRKSVTGCRSQRR